MLYDVILLYDNMSCYVRLCFVMLYYLILLYDNMPYYVILCHVMFLVWLGSIWNHANRYVKMMPAFSSPKISHPAGSSSWCGIPLHELGHRSRQDPCAGWSFWRGEVDCYQAVAAVLRPYVRLREARRTGHQVSQRGLVPSAGKLTVTCRYQTHLLVHYNFPHISTIISSTRYCPALYILYFLV